MCDLGNLRSRSYQEVYIKYQLELAKFRWKNHHKNVLSINAKIKFLLIRNRVASKKATGPLLFFWIGQIVEGHIFLFQFHCSQLYCQVLFRLIQ